MNNSWIISAALHELRHGESTVLVRVHLQQINQSEVSIICVNQSEKSIVLSQPMRKEYLPAQISSQPWTWDLHPHHSDHPENIKR